MKSNISVSQKSPIANTHPNCIRLSLFQECLQCNELKKDISKMKKKVTS